MSENNLKVLVVLESGEVVVLSGTTKNIRKDLEFFINDSDEDNVTFNGLIRFAKENNLIKYHQYLLEKEKIRGGLKPSKTYGKILSEVLGCDIEKNKPTGVYIVNKETPFIHEIDIQNTNRLKSTREKLPNIDNSVYNYDKPITLEVLEDVLGKIFENQTQKNSEKKEVSSPWWEEVQEEFDKTISSNIFNANMKFSKTKLNSKEIPDGFFDRIKEGEGKKAFFNQEWLNLMPNAIQANSISKKTNRLRKRKKDHFRDILSEVYAAMNNGNTSVTFSLQVNGSGSDVAAAIDLLRTKDFFINVENISNPISFSKPFDSASKPDMLKITIIWDDKVVENINSKIKIMSEQKQKLTFGQERVQLSFNPDQNEKVKSIKMQYAKLIDELEGMRTDEPRSEKNRCISEAQMDLEKSCMMAVKSIFKK